MLHLLQIEKSGWAGEEGEEEIATKGQPMHMIAVVSPARQVHLSLGCVQIPGPTRSDNLVIIYLDRHKL